MKHFSDLELDQNKLWEFHERALLIDENSQNGVAQRHHWLFIFGKGSLYVCLCM